MVSLDVQERVKLETKLIAKNRADFCNFDKSLNSFEVNFLGLENLGEKKRRKERERGEREREKPGPFFLKKTTTKCEARNASSESLGFAESRRLLFRQQAERERAEPSLPLAAISLRSNAVFVAFHLKS